jgi:hypothetical protein
MCGRWDFGAAGNFFRTAGTGEPPDDKIVQWAADKCQFDGQARGAKNEKPGWLARLVFPVFLNLITLRSRCDSRFLLQLS